MMNDTITHFINFALSQNIGVTMTNKLQPSTPSCSFVNQRKVIVNANAKDVAFQLVHEIGHIISNYDGVLYFSSFCAKCKEEGNANHIAVSMLMEYYFAETEPCVCNIDRFIKFYHIPGYLRDYCIKRMRELYG